MYATRVYFEGNGTRIGICRYCFGIRRAAGDALLKPVERNSSNVEVVQHGKLQTDIFANGKGRSDDLALRQRAGDGRPVPRGN